MMAEPPSDESLPLNLQQRERVDPHTGCKDVMPALHPSWCKDVKFLSYVPPPRENDDSALSLMWLEALELMDSDLHWLLCQPHQIFWCQVVYNTSLHKMLDSYLRYGPRPHEATPPVSLRGCELLTSVHRRVFMTFLRMSTHKESSNDYLLEDSFGDIIYNNFLFDITRLLDLCSLYHTCNHALLEKMIGNVFKRQPKYQDDLKSALKSVLRLLDHVTGECVREGGGEGVKGTAVRLEDLQSLPPSVVCDTILYVADIASSLHCFMEVYPPSVSLAVDCGLLERLVSFYEETIPPLQEQWLALKPSLNPESVAYQKCRLRKAKADMAWLVHTMIQSAFVSTGHQADGAVTRFLDIATAILSETAFLREFERHFSMAVCVQEVQALHPTFDQTQFDYILSALGVRATSGHAAASLMTPLMTGATPADEDACILSVLELLPYLSRNFVLRCLSEYGYDAEKVIHHVLEDTLPSHLRNLMSNENGEAADTSDVEDVTGDGVRSEGVRDEGGLLEHRVGVYDGDEFDVFSRKDVDLSQVNIGKRSVTTATILHDRSHMDTYRDRYQSYQYEYEFDQYQDEYDDTYDSHNVGAADSETTEDLFTVKRLNVKGLFRKQFDAPVEDEEEEGEGEGETEARATPLQAGHVTIMRRDPKQSGRRDGVSAQLGEGKEGGRGGKEEGRRGREAGRRGRGGREEGRRGGETEEGKGRRGGREEGERGWNEDGARGAGRGEGGREEEGRGAGREARDRQAKEKHKSRIANHSRKMLAAHKRGKGMGGQPR